MKIIFKNQKKGDCGVVAAFNAAWWCNRAISYQWVEKLAKSCGYNESNGMYAFQFAKLIKKLKLPANKIKPRSMEYVKDGMYCGKSYIFLYTRRASDRGHVIMTFLDHEGVFRIINPGRSLGSWKIFEQDLQDNGVRNFYVYELPSKHSDKLT